MNKTKNRVSPSQKKAQKKYDQKTKMVSIKYTLHDMNDFKRLKEYLDRTNQSANGFIKQLIKNFFAEGQDKKENRISNSVLEKREQQVDICPFVYIDEESIQILYDILGKDLAPRFLNEYYELIQTDIEDILEDNGYTFDEWITRIEKEITCGELEYSTLDNLYKVMFDDLSGNL